MNKFIAALITGTIGGLTSLVSATVDNSGVTLAEGASIALAFVVGIGGFYGVSKAQPPAE